MKSITRQKRRAAHLRNKFSWRFLALSVEKPKFITIEAETEAKARQQAPQGCVMVLSARFNLIRYNECDI
ncbi:host cell division inhibitor Icd-like protein [Enterobacter asburiae]|nr:host cell division inhibitor Icd-like protein [Enterobacter asburiae]